MRDEIESEKGRMKSSRAGLIVSMDTVRCSARVDGQNKRQRVSLLPVILVIPLAAVE